MLLFKSSTLKETQKEVGELATKEKTHKFILFRLGVHSLTSIGLARAWIGGA